MTFIFNRSADEPSKRFCITSELSSDWWDSALDMDLVRAPRGYNPYERATYPRLLHSSTSVFSSDFIKTLNGYKQRQKLSAGGKSCGQKRSEKKENAKTAYLRELRSVIEMNPRGVYNETTDRFGRAGAWDSLAMDLYNKKHKGGMQINKRTALRYRQELIEEGRLIIP